MRIKMRLLSDVIFGSGMSIPGEEDLSILTDAYGFPYFKGGTFKGIFREELIRYFDWTMTEEDKKEQESPEKRADKFLGCPGDDNTADEHKIIFSDFELSPAVRCAVIDEFGEAPDMILKLLSETRTFTRISEEGGAEKGSLRIARCVNKGLLFYSTIKCSEEDREMVEEVLRLIKWIGSMRNRGFGKVEISVEDQK